MNLSKRHIFFFGNLIHLISAWDYKYPHTWEIDYPDCGADKQSPINLGDVDEPSFDDSQTLSFENYDNLPFVARLKNNGHSVEVNLIYDSSSLPKVIKDGIEYKFQQMHFHYGSTDDRGSEHLMQNLTSPLELHIVHWNRELGDFDPEQGEGILVIGVLFKIGDHIADYIWDITDYAAYVAEPTSSSAEIRSFPLSQALPEPSNQEFLSYTGSLTTPPCSEGVSWLISMEPSEINKEQIGYFREVKSKHDDDHNNRPLQLINKRKVSIVSAN